MRHANAALLAAALLMCPWAASGKDDVTLRSNDGSVELGGRFLSYDGEFYRIDTVYGVLTVDSAGVDCVGQPCPNAETYVPDLLISGAAMTNSALAPALLEAFAASKGLAFIRQDEDPIHFLYVLSDTETDEPVARVRFRLTTSAEGFADLLAEQADFVLAFREPTVGELERAREVGLGDLRSIERSRVIALDGLVPVVAPGNPVNSISLNDLAFVVAGRIRNWADLGGPDRPIKLHLPKSGSGASDSLGQRVLTPNDLQAQEQAIRHESAASLDAAVSMDPAALGVTVFSEIAKARVLAIAGTCGARVTATPMSIKNQDYPLTAPHFVLTPGRRAPPIVREFLSFIQNPAAQPIVRDAGFVDQSIELRPVATQGDRLARAILATSQDVSASDLRRMVGKLASAKRLSLTFRFEDGSVDLDAQSRASLSLLVEAIGRGEYDGRTLFLAGFSDGQGGGVQNLDLSRRRAEAVRTAILSMLHEAPNVTLTAEGFGEAMPMACDEDAWGRQVNRRVEVWLRQM